MLYCTYWGVGLLTSLFYLRMSDVSDLRLIKIGLFLGFSFLSFIIFGFKERTHKTNAIVPTFAVISFLSFVNQHNYYSLAVITQFICLNVAFLLCMQMLGELRDCFKKEVILNFIAVSCVLQALWFILNNKGIDPYLYILQMQGYQFQKILVGSGKLLTPSSVDYANVVGSLGQQTLSGAYLAASTPALFRKKWNYTLPIILYALYLSGSAMTWIAFCFCSLSYLFLKGHISKRILIWSMPVFLVLSYTLWDHLGFFDDQRRFMVWSKTMEWMSGPSIIWGKGLGYFFDNFNTFMPLSPKWVYAHNEYIDLYVAFGLIGLFYFSAVMSYIAYIAKHEPIFSSIMVAILINAAGNFPLHVPAISLLFIISFSAVLNYNKQIDIGEIQNGISSDES